MADEQAVTAEVLRRLGAHITGINDTTRDGIREIIRQAIADGVTPLEAARRVREWSGWDEYRAEMIARTELVSAYNAAALGAYDDLGVRQVIADDGDKDEQCAARHGQVFSVDDATAISDHPNGTLDWLPVAEGLSPERVRQELHEVRPIRGMP